LGFFIISYIYPFRNTAESRELIIDADLHELRKNLYDTISREKERMEIEREKKTSQQQNEKKFIYMSMR